MAKFLGINIPFTPQNEIIETPPSGKDSDELLITKIVERQQYRTNATVGKWRGALNQAEDVINPNRQELIRLYKEIELDTHLTAVANSRILAVTGQQFKICNANGEINEVLTDAINKDWFDKFVVGSLESIFYGYTVFQFDDIENLEVNYISQFPRQNVDPDRKLIKQEATNYSGIPYNEDPYQNLIIEVGKFGDLGLLNKCAPLAMFKKDSWANWADFQELFGIPPRVGRTDVRNSTLRANMEKALANMGKLFYAVMDKDDSIELIQTNRGDSYQVFVELINSVDKQLSKLVLGQTGTTDEKAFSGSSGVHERKEQAITRADVKFIERTVNDKLFPMLRVNGWSIPEDIYFMYDKTEQVSKLDRFEMLTKLLPTYKIDPSYIKEEFNIEVSEKEESEPKAEEKKSPISEVINLFTELDNFYQVDEVLNAKKKSINTISEAEENKFISGVYNGVYNEDNLPEFIYKSIGEDMEREVKKGYGPTLAGAEKTKLLNELTTSVYKFSGAKTYQETKALGLLVYDKNGSKKTVAQFKKEAKEVMTVFNKNYARTELETAFSNSQNARDWQKFEAEADVLPFLRYRSQGDSKVRPDHIDLEGITLPVGDPFWSSYTPTNGYNCRCFLEQVEEGAKITSKKKLPSPKDLPKGFNNNPAKTGEIFTEKHPYYEAPKKKVDNNFGLPLPNKVNTFTPAKTLKEAEERIRELGVKKVELNGLKSNQYNSVLKSLEVQNQYKKFELDRLHTYRKTSKQSTNIAVYSPSNNSIGLNLTQINKTKLQGAPKSFSIQKKGLEQSVKDWERAIKRYDDAPKNYKNIKGRREAVARVNSLERRIKKIDNSIKNDETPLSWSIPSSQPTLEKSLESTITHEMGHYRDYKQYRGKGVNNFFNFDKSKAVTDYAKHNKEEFFAESYTNYFHGDKEKTPKQLLKTFEEWK